MAHDFVEAVLDAQFLFEIGFLDLDLELDAEAFLDLLDRDHLDGGPGAAVEERAVRTVACTLLAANAQVRVNFDPSERRIVLVGNPVHAVFDGAIGYARR